MTKISPFEKWIFEMANTPKEERDKKFAIVQKAVCKPDQINRYKNYQWNYLQK